MSYNPIKENSFDAAPGGSAGAINTQPGYGTFASPNVSQNPASFNSSDGRHKTPAKLGQMSESGSAALTQAVDMLFKKKDTPTIDDVAAGMDYELSKMVIKDKRVAKGNVIANLKKNPHYYSDLDQLNINMDKTPEEIEKEKQLAETVRIFNEMAKEKPQREVPTEISNIMREMWEIKQRKRFGV